jgi:hypothetical protein
MRDSAGHGQRGWWPRSLRARKSAVTGLYAIVSCAVQYGQPLRLIRPIATYLDDRPITAEEKALIADIITSPWLSAGVEDRALGYAIASLVPNHLAEVRRRKLGEIDKVEREVRARLTREINYWDARAARLREEERAGKVQRVNASNAEATAQRLVERLHKRQTELERERQITALPPILKGAALVIPRGLLQSRLPRVDLQKPFGFSEDPAARAVVE